MSQMITLTPIGGGTGYGMSALKSFSFFLLFAGIVLISVGYIRAENRDKPSRVEFRYLPRTFEEEQSTSVPLLSTFSKLFQDRDPWSKLNGFVNVFPWERGNISNNLLAYQTPMSGFGRAVGDRVVG
jgi:hypothetical protein